MNRVLIGIILLVVLVVGLGFYQGWFHAGSDAGSGKPNITLSVDNEKFQEDRKAAVAQVENLGHQIRDKVSGSSEKSIDGTVVNLAGDKMTMKDQDGKEQVVALADNVKITRDGKSCVAADLTAGMKIRVTIEAPAPHAAVRIEGLEKDAEFASNRHDGKAVSVTDTKLVMTNLEGMNEHAFTLASNARITCDGKACKAADLRSGMRMRVTTENTESLTATRIEALDNNADFEKGI